MLLHSVTKMQQLKCKAHFCKEPFFHKLSSNSHLKDDIKHTQLRIDFEEKKPTYSICHFPLIFLERSLDVNALLTNFQSSQMC